MEEQTKTKKPTRRLTRTEWLEARALFESGAATASEISRRFSVSKSCVSDRIKKDGWKERGELREKAIEQATENVITNMAQRFETEAVQVNDSHKKILNAIKSVGVAYLKKMQANAAEPDPKKRDKVNADIYALASLSTLLKTVVDAERIVYHIDKLIRPGDIGSDGFDRLCDMLEKRAAGMGDEDDLGDLDAEAA